MPRPKTARQWEKFPYEVDKLSTNEKSHIPDEVLAQIPAHIFIAKFRDEEGDNVETTIMPREIWTLHRRPEVASAVRAVHLEQFFRLPPWGTYYMRAHELMSSIQYDGKAMLTDSDGAKVEVLITKEIINKALQFLPGAYDLIPKTKTIDNEKVFLKVKGIKFKYTEPFLHMAMVMALCVAEKRQVRCDYAKFILETLIEANLKNSAKNKLYMSVGPMLTRVAYQALGMIENLPAVSSQAALIQQAKYVPKAIKTTSSTASSRSTRSKKSSSDDERIDTDKEQNSQESAREDVPKEVEAASPSEYKRSDEEDTSTPLEKKSQKPRSREQVLMDEAMARVEARRKELDDARAAKVAKTARPMTMEEARKLRIEKAKALQKERKRLEAEEKAQEEAEAAQAIQTQEKELAREKIKEALSRKAKEPVLEPSQGSPKRPRQEEEEEIEHIQADPILSSPMNIPHAPPSSPITPFPPASTPRTPPSPSPPDLPRSPPAPTSPQQQQFSAEPIEIPTSLQEETKQPMDRTEEEKKQTDNEQQKPAETDLPIPIMQLEEPTNEEAFQEVKNFDYTKMILTLSRQFQCQQVVAKKTDIQKDRANRAYEEITNLRTALELSQLTRKEAWHHELIKNKKKMKEQLKYEDARFQKITASYNTIKSTLTTLLQNQEPASAIPSISDSATANTLAALQEELQTEKLQKQLLVSGFMSQTVQHKAKVKQLELELAQAKANLELQKQQTEVLSKGKEAVGSLASTSQIHQAKTHLHIQQPLMPEMPEFQSPQEEEQSRPAPGALDIREQME
ncbi:hypothetical protein L7F22_049615 [Adiantum nelumboides]|nr:hypothetical protein [Adiantum nelumboides]